ncbi:MAG: SCO family protein [Paracraurococcus sp.]
MQGRLYRRALGVAGLGVLAAVGAAAWLHGAAQAPGSGPSVAGEPALPLGIRLGGPFTLTDHLGNRFTDHDLHGGWTLLYFGYTSCPDVCPTELQTMSAALGMLAPDLAARVRPVFATIDPERDTATRLASYVTLFDPRLIGLTGTPEQVAQAARAFRVYYARSRAEGSTDYLMDHSSFIYLLDPDGAVRALFRAGTTAEDLATALRRRLA